MQEAGASGGMHDVAGVVRIRRVRVQVQHRADDRRGFGRSTRQGNVDGLDHAVVMHRAFHRRRVTAKLGHEAEADPGGEQHGAGRRGGRSRIRRSAIGEDPGLRPRDAGFADDGTIRRDPRGGGYPVAAVLHRIQPGSAGLDEIGVIRS